MANNRRIALVESCFGNSGQPLNVDGRVLVGQGVLQKSCRKALKNRRFFLFNDILVYGNIIVDMKRYSKQHIIPLEEVKLEILPVGMQCILCTMVHGITVKDDITKF